MARRRALLLEDDVALRDLLLEAFGSEDIDVRTCSSFEEVRVAAAHAEADVVVADFWGGSQRTLPQSERDEIRELCSYLPGCAADRTHVGVRNQRAKSSARMRSFASRLISTTCCAPSNAFSAVVRRNVRAQR